MSQARNAAIVGFILLAFAGWLFRYDVEPMSKTQVVRLDRITGAVRLCDAVECIEPSLSRGIPAEKRAAMEKRSRQSADAVPEANPLLEDWRAEQEERNIKP